MSTIAEPTAALVPAGTWSIDPDHSLVEFAVKHLGFATIKGRVGVFAGSLVGGEHARLEGTLDLKTLTTHAGERDAHLRTSDFFDAERHPEGRIVSTAVEPDGDGLAIAAELTLRGVTRAVELRGALTGAGVDPWGNERIGLDLEGVIDRLAWGIAWNMPLSDGGLLVSNDVRVSAFLSLVRS